MVPNQELIDILACPKCKDPLNQTEEPQGFGCPTCNLLYKTEDDIPNFLISEAIPWKKETTEVGPGKE
jgi:uncharacterized protein YbaR (Trm112 family)